MITFNLLTKLAISLFFISLTGFVICDQTIKPVQDYCSMSTFEKCLSMIEEVSRNEKYAFATTLEQLNETCSLLKRGVQCLNFQFKRCTSQNRFAAFEKVVTGTKKVIERLCQPGPVQDDYLKFSKCYRKVIFIYVKREVECSYWIQSLQNIQSQPANPNKTKEEQNKELRTFCCAYNKSLGCQLELIKLHCDQEALDFFYIHSNRMSQQLITEHCSVFNEDNKKYCKYNPVAKENEPNKNLKINNSNSLIMFKIEFISILILNLVLIVRQINFIF